MAKTLTAAAQAKLDARTNVEPILVVEVQWGGPVGTRYYGDRTFALGSINVDGRLLSAGNVRAQQAVNAEGSVGSVPIVLDDYDQALRMQMESSALEFKRCRLWLHFQGNAEADMILLTDGRAGSPVEWRDETRTVMLEIVMGGTSDSFGEIAETPICSEEAEGRVIPAVWGLVDDVPAILCDQSPRGALEDDLPPTAGVGDTFEIVGGSKFTQSSLITLRVGREFIKGFMSGDTCQINERNVDKYYPVYWDARDGADEDASNPHVAWLADPSQRIVNNYVVFRYNLVPFTFANLCIKQTGSKVWFEHPFIRFVDDNRTFAAWKRNDYMLVNATILGGSEGHVRYYDPGYSGLIWWTLEAGSVVSEFGNEGDTYAFNAFPTASVTRVRARREKAYDDYREDVDNLVDVPSEYYTVDNSAPSKIAFPVRLSELGEGWRGNEIYVSLVSTKGNNPVDIIAFLLNNYTDLTPGDGFDMETLPAGPLIKTDFAVTGVVDALQLAADIAWQARGALSVVGQTVTFKYLPDAPAAGDVDLLIDRTNVVEASPILTATDMDSEVYTILEVSYQESYAEAQKTLRWVHNADRYGNRELSMAVWVYHGSDTLKASLVNTVGFFWSRFYGSAWRMIRLRCNLQAIPLEVFDNVRVELPDIISPSPLFCRVVVTEYDADNNEVLLTLLTGVEVGTNTENWPP